MNDRFANYVIFWGANLNDINLELIGINANRRMLESEFDWSTYEIDRKTPYYTDGDFWRREHHGMFLSRGLKWYWGKIISPETKSRDLYSSRNIISNPKILGTFRDVPDNKVAICYIVWLPIAPIALPGFGIARRNIKNSVFFSAGIFFKLCAVQCVAIVLCAAVQRVSIVLCAQ